MVPFLKFNPAETTSAWALQGRGQVQQKPNSLKVPIVEAHAKKTQRSGSDKKPTVLETGTAKRNSAESSRGSDSRRPSVRVGSPHSYGWKDIWLTKS